MNVLRFTILLAGGIALFCAGLVIAACFFGKWQPSTEIAYVCGGHICLVDANWGFVVDPTPNRPYGASNPTWSPDGNWIAAEGYMNNVWSIYMMDAEGGQQQLLVRDGADPAWSPDGRRIAYSRFGGENWDIYAIEPGVKSRLIYHDTMDKRNPVWSPDGTRIAYQAVNEGGYSDIYIIGVDGKNLQRLTDGNGIYFDPVWSPDGTQIAAFSAAQGGRDIVMLDLNGNLLGHVTDYFGAYDGSPTWSPDGSQIAFDSDRLRSPALYNNWSIYVTNPDGSDLRYITEGIRPAWRPDVP